MTIIMRMNSGPDIPATALEAQYRSVSEIRPFSIIRLTPRARPMMSETPTRLEAPLMNASVTVFSSRPHRNMQMMATVRNEAAICGNHQP